MKSEIYKIEVTDLSNNNRLTTRVTKMMLKCAKDRRALLGMEVGIIIDRLEDAKTC